MSESQKPSQESKPQPAPQPKPSAPNPGERNLRTEYTFVTDSADRLRGKNK
ncbi:hypothetical protein GTH23_08605 [Proteus terrae subsp. cibarius]|uniref:Uncharacterized protein n=1 Tax=Proteus terrae subsp. cibarius TaxID=626774 RepID=A0ABX6JLN8_9GAMM|nr:hypothetical protein [Proteus terrae]QIF90094.1 hypothetical protein GTH23_08605 [Proteus terrae subsp. cibarius]HCZ8416645.1 hypothetical protein [Proteus mirabilis]